MQSLSIFRPLENGPLVVCRFLNALQYIVLGLVQRLLPRHSQWDLRTLAPSYRSFLDGTHIQYSVGKVVVHFLVRLFPQERLVTMYRISCQQPDARLGDVFLDVCQELICSLFGLRFRGYDCCCETAFAVSPITPFVLVSRSMSALEREVAFIPSYPSSPSAGVSQHPILLDQVPQGHRL